MWEWRTTARSPTTSRMTDREEVEGPLEPRVAEGEVRRRDRRDEALVEALRDPQRSVDAVPAEPQRELVGAQLACVEQPQDLDPREARLEQRPVLLERVLANVPRVVRLHRPGGGEREPVRGRDVRERGRAGDRPQQPLRVLDVLDGLQE